MRYFLILLLICSAFISKAQTVPSGAAQANWYYWVHEHTQMVSDSGFGTTFIDTSLRPTIPMMIMSSIDSSIWYYNMVKWQPVAAPSTDFVKYSDSLTIFTTPSQLHDSLGNYVTLFSPQTLGALAAKTFNANQTFNKDIIANRQFTGSTDSAEVNSFTKLDSLQNTGFNPSNSFRNILRNLSYSNNHSMTLPPVLQANQSLTIYKQQDTLNDLLANRGAMVAITTFIKKNNAEDTLNIKNVNANGALKSFVAGLNVTGDSSDIVANNTYWNVNLPFSYLYTYTSVTNHGHIPYIADATLGHTEYADNSGGSDSAFTIAVHDGLHIVPLIDASVGINTAARAIWQEGMNDSVILNSNKIFAKNLPNSTTSYTLYFDPATGKFTYGLGGSGGASKYFTAQALTDQATIAMNCDNGFVGTVTLGGNRNITFSNFDTWHTVRLKITQDGTGNRTLTFPANTFIPNGFGSVTTLNLTTTAAAIDFVYVDFDGTNYWVTLAKNYIH